MNFTDFNLGEDILRAIQDLGFTSPTPIQELMIPQVISEPDDVVGLAHTGTGKTAAFGLPVINRIDIDNRSPQALVLCPTRELCIQIAGELKNYGKYVRNLSVTSIYGGDSYDRQKKDLRKGSHIIVATPGRLLDLLNGGSADISGIRFLVLDEADIMLNMGFKEELDSILESAPEERQTILLSATMPKEVVRIAKTYMKSPIELSVGRKNSGTESVEHAFYTVRRDDKYPALKRLVDFHPDIYAIVFCRTKAATQEIAEKLVKDGYNAESLHGDLSQAQREHVMSKFRSGSVQLLIATDIAARGLDVDDLTHVIHYDLPTEADAYTHRSGRTGRAGKTGVSLALITDKERNRIRWIEKTVQRDFTEAQIPGKREICEQQLVKLMNRICEADINTEELLPYMPLIEEKFASLSREELLQKFLSLEFGKFIDYYKNLKDIRPAEKNLRQSGKNRDWNSGGKSGRKYPEHRSGKSQKWSRTNEAERFDWIELNLGRESRILPLDIIGLVNRHTNSGNIQLGRIDIGPKKSWIQVESNAATEVQDALRKATYKGRRIKAERSADSPGRAKKTA